MKRLAMVLMISVLAAPAIFGASGTWVATLSDSHCGPSHKDNGPSTGGQILNDAECTALCIAAKAKYVLVANNAVYAIANQNFKGLGSYLAQTVQVEGDLDGTTVTVTKISKAPKKK
jgi:hypothetical protein